MFRKLISMALVGALSFSLLLAGCGQKAASNSGTEEKQETSSAETQAAASTQEKQETKEAKKVKVGFIYIGPVKDGGWTEAHDNGKKYLEEKLGVETLYKELVPEGPDSKKSIMELIDQGCNVIFTTSYGYMDPTLEVAKEFPDVKFFHCSGFKTAENMSNYFGRMYQPRYLSGIVAGLKTKSNKIGYVAAFEIPEVINGINAFTLGVQSVNPDAKVIVRWSHTWIDAATEKNVAVALLDEGCDVISQHNDSTSPQIAAEERGAFAIGYDLDIPTAAPKAYMTAPIWNWGPYYVEQVQAVMDGTWKSSVYFGGLKEGIVDLAPLTAVAPEGAKAKVDEMKAKMMDGSFKVFEGPIKDQSGAVKVEAGKFLSDEEINTMNWFIQGVEGKIEAN